MTAHNVDLEHIGVHVVLMLTDRLSSQPKSLDKATELFDRADMNDDGKLSLAELAGVLKSASQEYSHLAEHVRFLDGCVPADGQLDYCGAHQFVLQVCSVVDRVCTTTALVVRVLYALLGGSSTSHRFVVGLAEGFAAVH